VLYSVFLDGEERPDRLSYNIGQGLITGIVNNVVILSDIAGAFLVSITRHVSLQVLAECLQLVMYLRRCLLGVYNLSCILYLRVLIGCL